MTRTADQQRSRGRRRSGAPSLIMGIVLLLAGLALMLYPTFSALMAQAEIDRSLDALLAEGASGTSSRAEAADAPADEGAASVGHATDAEKAADATYQQLASYNERVRTGEGGAVNDPFAFDSDALAALGLPDGIVGKIDIPAMGVTIPLYLGATEAHMVDGAGVVAGTSAPLGEASSNCVIAAHRGGYHGLAMFRDIEKLAVGDTVTVTTPWDTFTYEVTETRVVEPDDVDAVAVQPGRDLVTLLTCHPYGTNRYRMLVTCERTDDVRQTPASLVADALTQLTPDLTSDSPLLTLEGVLRLIGLGVLMALGATLVGQALRRRRRRTRLGTQEGAYGDAPGRTLTRSSSRAGDGEPPRPAGGHFKT